MNLYHALRHRELLAAMLKREMLGRYRGSWLGLLWSLLTPLLLLLVYVFVFGVVFQARWPQVDAGSGDFAALLFAGISVYFFCAEVITGSPKLVVDNANYVKKVVFPLDVLVWVKVLAAMLHFLISLVLLVAFVWWRLGPPAIWLLTLPLLIVPLTLLLTGIAWLFSGIGVYVRDLTYVAGFLATALMFLSPVFYPVSAVPESFGLVMELNPLSFYIEAFRTVVVLREPLDIVTLSRAWFIALAVFVAGFALFRRVRRGFADVL